MFWRLLAKAAPEFLAEAGLLNSAFDVFDTRPYGLDGGAEGAGGSLSVTRDGETVQLAAKTVGHPLKAGDVVRMQTPGGGGHGDPAARAPEAVAEDRADGYV